MEENRTIPPQPQQNIPEGKNAATENIVPEAATAATEQPLQKKSFGQTSNLKTGTLIELIKKEYHLK